jgi:hypothetical protein
MSNCTDDTAKAIVSMAHDDGNLERIRFENPAHQKLIEDIKKGTGGGASGNTYTPSNPENKNKTKPTRPPRP